MTERAAAPHSPARIVALLVPTLSFFVALLYVGAPFCCDGSFYLKTIAGYRADGLLYDHDLLGYRAYLFPYLFGLLPLDLGSFAVDGVRVYSIVSIAAFLAIELAVLFRLRHTPFFWTFYVGLFANPLVLVYVPYPLQESFLVLAFAALVPWLVTIEPREQGLRLPLLCGVFFGVMYMARAWHLVLVLPVTLLFFAHVRALRAPRARVLALAAFGVPALALIAPQSLVALHHLGTPVPYPTTTVLSKQLEYGAAFAKYATDVSGRPGAPMPHWSPLHCASPAPSAPKLERRFVCSVSPDSTREGIEAAVFTGMIHVFNGLDYHVLRPYVADRRVPLFSAPQLLSMTVVFLGGYAVLRKLFLGGLEPRDVFLGAIAGVTLAVTTITAVETRFGLLATASLSHLAADLVLRGRPAASEWLPVAFGLACFLWLSSLLSVYVVALSAAAAP